MNTTRDVQMSSGSEVESAMAHPSSYELGGTGMTVVERPGMRGRLDDLKSLGISKVHDIRRVVSNRSAVVKSSIRSAKTSTREGAKMQLARVQTSMRESPMKWAGIAAGTGFSLGLIGRIVRGLSKRRRATPDIVIIEASC